jgi:ankyrin repeat protein
VPTRSLPPRPSVTQLKIQANELHQEHRDGVPSAAARIAAHHPRFKGQRLQAVLDAVIPLADAQLVIAREYGFDTWARLKHHVELGDAVAMFRPHPRFDEAVAAMDAGDLERLRSLLAAEPTLAHARTNLDPPYHYFTGATLLHHVAGNPDRGRLDGKLPRLPANSPDVARLLLDAGADVNARTLGPNPGDTMGLLVTSKQASDADVVGPLIDVLREYGARLDVERDGCLDGSLANHAPRAAEKLIELGAQPDILAAAALGRMDLLRAFFDAEGRLLSRPRRHNTEMTARDAIGLALLYAYVREQREAVDFLLEKDGNWDMTGVNNGAALHRAAVAGDLQMVERLVAKGADVSNRDNPFSSSPLGWADHNNQAEVVQWLRTHCAIDLHDAASFDFLEHVEARLSEDPASVNRRIDHWDIPQSTALHGAASMGRVDAARVLLRHDADPDILAGNGLTPLDVADANGAAAVAALLEERGATRTTVAGKTRDRMDLKPLEAVANDMLDAYRSGEPSALQRVQDFFKQTFSWSEMRTRLPQLLGKPADAEISLADTQQFVAHSRGFGSWIELAKNVVRTGGRAKKWNLPLYRIDEKNGTLQVRHSLDDKEWDEIIAAMAEQGIASLDANGQMTDAVLERVARLGHMTRINFGGTKQLTDHGLRHLAKLSRLQEVDLSEYPGGQITDLGLEVLRDLPELRRFQMCWQRGISDVGVANLRFCDQLESVDLLGTHTGDGAIHALAGKRKLRRFKTGRGVTDSALPLLHQFPIFKTWHGGDLEYSLMSADAEPNHLLLDGPFTNRGLAGLAGLDGLFGLSFFWHISALTGAGLEGLAALPNLGFLGCEGKLCDDDAMRHIGAIPHLRMLMGQGTVASDDGFAALSRSPTIEYIWGRECPNLTGRGFRALSTMPALRGLAVSCKGVDDGALSALPRFPALRDLMPMDVPDEGFRHVGKCENLEGLWCMYCRDTTDAATEHIAGLPRLKTYYAGQTKITDRSLEILSRMTSLEKLEFWNCGGITNAGVAHLAVLPALGEISVDGCRQVTPGAVAVFPTHVRARYSV